MLVEVERRTFDDEIARYLSGVKFILLSWIRLWSGRRKMTEGVLMNGC